MATDSTGRFQNNLTSPAINAALVTPDDEADLDFTTRAISFSTAGTLKVTMAGMDDGESITIPDGALAAGILHPLRVKRVWEASTAASIVAWW